MGEEVTRRINVVILVVIIDLRLIRAVHHPHLHFIMKMIVMSMMIIVKIRHAVMHD
jgi:hypothetical protein